MYIKIKNGSIERYPYSIDILRKENSNTSFPQNLTKELLESFGVYRVSEMDRPETNESSYAVKRHLPELVDGEYKLLWDVIKKTPEQIAEEIEFKKVQVRDQRNNLLSSSDWTQVADAPLTAEQKVAWAAYRQALRDLPQQPGFPDIDLPRSPDSVEIGD